MKRLLYLAILSMVILTVSAPAALAQQGNGLCAGAQAVDSFSNNTNITSDPINISTDTFQIAVQTTPAVDTSDGSLAETDVTITDSNFATLTSDVFTDGESGIIDVQNNGAGPFTVDIFTFQQAYDITVYECGAATGGDMDDDNGMTGGMDDDMTDNGDTSGMTDDDADDMNGGATAGQGAGAVQYDDDADDVAGAAQYDDADDNEMTELPDTSGPALMPLAGLALLAAGGLGLTALRKRAE